jgi:uncharacterized repeat protein (TIGR03803 family)
VARLAELSVIVLALGPCPAWASSTFQSLHSFCQEDQCKDGEWPGGPVTLDGAGNIYGTTTAGGDFGGGTVYTIAADGTFSTLHSFCGGDCRDGRVPRSDLIVDVSGAVYGTALYSAGDFSGGSVFKLTPSADRTHWSFVTLYHFPNEVGSEPISLTYAGAASGALYDGQSPLFGTTIWGGRDGYGSIFRLDRVPQKSSRYGTAIYSFCDQGCVDGENPNGGISFDQSGNMYGFTAFGGNFNGGVVYMVSPSGAETVLHSFCEEVDGQVTCPEGYLPVGTPALDADGHLFGSAERDDNFSGGDIFRIKIAGANSKLDVLYKFCSQPSCADGLGAVDVELAPDGDLYGAAAGGGAYGHGAIFRVHRKSESVLYSFCQQASCVDGSTPGPLTLDGSSRILGVTAGGGTGANDSGTVFQLSR